MGLKIIKTNKNPKRKTHKAKMKRARKRKVIRARKNPKQIKIGDTVKINAPGLPGNGKTGKVLGMHRDHYQIASDPSEYKNYMHPASRLTVVNAKKNPIKRKRHETLIVGFAGRGTPTKLYGSKNSQYYKIKRRKKTARFYFTGTGFSRKRQDAEIFPGDAAKIKAKQIINRLPWGIYAIQVENA